MPSKGRCACFSTFAIPLGALRWQGGERQSSSGAPSCLQWRGRPFPTLRPPYLPKALSLPPCARLSCNVHAWARSLARKHADNPAGSGRDENARDCMSSFPPSFLFFPSHIPSSRSRTLFPHTQSPREVEEAGVRQKLRLLVGTRAGMRKKACSAVPRGRSADAPDAGEGV